MPKADTTEKKVNPKLIARLHELSQYENELYTGEKKPIFAGVDEAGRGPLAGPVVACAVILPEGFTVYGVDDSKKLTEKRRSDIYNILKENVVAWSTGKVNEDEIDKINILQATYKAMKEAITKLKEPPEHILVDGYAIPGLDIPQTPIIRGDSLSLSIAAASILAKVTRDKLMYEYDKKYPEYGFASHKGYCTALHIQAIQKYGLCPIHRKSFTKKFIKDVGFYEG